MSATVTATLLKSFDATTVLVLNLCGRLCSRSAAAWPAFARAWIRSGSSCWRRSSPPLSPRRSEEDATALKPACQIEIAW